MLSHFAQYSCSAPLHAIRYYLYVFLVEIIVVALAEIDLSDQLSLILVLYPPGHVAHFFVSKYLYTF